MNDAHAVPGTRSRLAPTIDWRAKGFPALEGALEPGEVGALGWSLFDERTMFPLMVVRERALAHDIALMAEWTRAHGVSLAPHGKTTMSPAIWRRQLDAGAWAITVATPWQARVAAMSGVPRIVIANEVVDEAGIAWLASTLEPRAPEVLCYVDSVVGVERLAARLGGSHARRLAVLVEVGLPGTRAGARNATAALEVCRRVAATQALRLAGVAFFEGTVSGETWAERVAAVRAFCDLARSVAREAEPLMRADGAGEIVLTGGGSTYVDTVVEELTRPLGTTLPVHVVVRSGAYVSHDLGTYEESSPFGERSAQGGPRLWPALEVWSVVLSVPERGLAICGAGKRDLAYDAGLPRVVKVRGADGRVRAVTSEELTVARLYDQHAVLALGPGAWLEVGDLIGMGVSHPCSAFDRWRWLPVVDDDDHIVDVYELVF